MIKTRIEAPLYPTEDFNKVKKAIENIIPGIDCKIEKIGKNTYIVGEIEGVKGLKLFHQQLREQQILDTARSVLKRSVSGNTIIFYIRKQAAFMGKIHFCDAYAETPLGPITIQITSDDPQKIIDWLAPPTKRGQPIFEIKIQEE